MCAAAACRSPAARRRRSRRRSCSAAAGSPGRRCRSGGAARHLPAGEPVDLLAGDVDAAAGRARLAQHQPQERRLAGAGGADEEDELALLDVDVDVVERRPLLAGVHRGDVLESDHRVWVGRCSGTGKRACRGERPAVVECRSWHPTIDSAGARLRCFADVGCVCLAFARVRLQRAPRTRCSRPPLALGGRVRWSAAAGRRRAERRSQATAAPPTPRRRRRCGRGGVLRPAVPDVALRPRSTGAASGRVGEPVAARTATARRPGQAAGVSRRRARVRLHLDRAPAAPTRGLGVRPPVTAAFARGRARRAAAKPGCTVCTALRRSGPRAAPELPAQPDGRPGRGARAVRRHLADLRGRAVPAQARAPTAPTCRAAGACDGGDGARAAGLETVRRPCRRRGASGCRPRGSRRCRRRGPPAGCRTRSSVRRSLTIWYGFST